MKQTVGASRLWWKVFVDKVSFEPEWNREWVMHGESDDKKVKDELECVTLSGDWLKQGHARITVGVGPIGTAQP